MSYHSIESTLNNFSEQYSKRKVAFFFGAGISSKSPTNLPLGNKVKDALLSGFYQDLKINKIINSTNFKLISTRPFEEICGVILNETKNSGLLSTLSNIFISEKLEPNLNHYLLAQALHDGHILITTNFDNMIEKAYCKLFNKQLTNICYDDKTTHCFPVSPNKRYYKDLTKHGWYFKYHGSFTVNNKDTLESIIATYRKMGKYGNNYKEPVIKNILRNCPLLVLGYSCLDIDLIKSIFLEYTSSNEIWWINHTENNGRILNNNQIRKEQKKNIRELSYHNVLSVLSHQTKDNGNVHLLNINTDAFIHQVKKMIDSWNKLDIVINKHHDDTPIQNLFEAQLKNIGNVSAIKDKLMFFGKISQISASTKLLNKKTDYAHLYHISNLLYKQILNDDAITLSESDKIKIYKEIGWNYYKIDSENNTDISIENYQKALSYNSNITWLQKLELLSLISLSYRRGRQVMNAIHISDEIWNLLPYELKQYEEMTVGEIKSCLIHFKVETGDFNILGSIFRRIAAAYEQWVSGPYALSTAIPYAVQNNHWKTMNVETDLLSRGKVLLERDWVLQDDSGDFIQKIQTENQLGLILSKKGEFNDAIKYHEDSYKVGELYSKSLERGQALRNKGLALDGLYQYENAIKTLKKARTYFKEYSGDDETTKWHIGRILIKNNKEEGLNFIKKHLDKQYEDKKRRSWHWIANDHCLLGIGYWDIIKDINLAKDHFNKMIEIYPKNDEGKLDYYRFRNRTYSIDNALANTYSVYDRLLDNNGSLLRTVSNYMEQLKKFRLAFSKELYDNTVEKNKVIF